MIFLNWNIYYNLNILIFNLRMETNSCKIILFSYLIIIDICQTSLAQIDT